MTNHPTFQSIVNGIYKLLGDLLLVDDGCGRRDVWHEFTAAIKPHYTVTLQKEDDGWHLLDGDPVCNWCFNTFDKRYDFSASVKTIARRIRHELEVNQPRLDNADKKAFFQQGKKFSTLVNRVIQRLPSSMKPIGFNEIVEKGWTHCAFGAKGRRPYVVLTLEGEFGDFWLRGGKHNMRERWTGKPDVCKIAQAIVTGLRKT